MTRSSGNVLHVWACRLLTSALAMSALLKLVALAGIAVPESMVPYRAESLLPGWVLAVLVFVELVLASGLVAWKGNAVWLLLTSAFLVGATVFVLLLRSSGRPLSSCGCFGPFADRTGGIHLAVNGSLIFVSGVALLTRPFRAAEKPVAQGDKAADGVHRGV